MYIVLWSEYTVIRQFIVSFNYRRSTKPNNIQQGGSMVRRDQPPWPQHIQPERSEVVADLISLGLPTNGLISTLASALAGSAHLMLCRSMFRRSRRYRMSRCHGADNRSCSLSWRQHSCCSAHCFNNNSQETGNHSTNCETLRQTNDPCIENVSYIRITLVVYHT